MPNTNFPTPETASKTAKHYRFEETNDKRWAIYFQNRLLATIGSYEACKSIGESLDKNMSYSDALKAAINYKKSINRSLTLG